jgi:hypothetical protein
MFADDTQLFNKNDESVKKSFDILTINEKASYSPKVIGPLVLQYPPYITGYRFGL